MQNVFQCTILKQSFKTKELFVAVPLGMAGGYFLMNTLLFAFGRPLFQKDWMPWMIALFAVLFLLRILLFYTHKGSLVIYKEADGEMSVKIVFRNREEATKKGNWSMGGMYTRTETLPGMFVKYTHLALVCNNKVLCVLRGKRNALQKVHPVYEKGISGMEMAEEYWCGQVNKIISVFEKEIIPNFRTVNL